MISLPEPDNPICVADWLELDLALNNRPVSKADLEKHIERFKGSEPTEAEIDDVWMEMDYRDTLYKNSPFVISGQVINPTIHYTSRPEYKACLLFSLFKVATFMGGASLFERMTGIATKGYLHGESVVMGWSSFQATGTTALDGKIANVANQMNEIKGEPPNSWHKDRGVDVIGWRSFNDNRSGQTVILLQSAAGHHWSMKKPVSKDAWKKYIKFEADPMIAIAIPFIVPPMKWRDKHDDFGLVIDRVRILNMLPNGLSDPVLNSDLNNWIDEVVKDKQE